MKLLVTALSASALSVCGAVALTTCGGVQGVIGLLKAPPKPAPVSIEIEPPAFKLDEVVRAMARKHGVRQGFIKSIIAAESAGNPEALSNKGAVGLMQLMPETARDLGVDPSVPEQNVDGGTRYLRWLIQRYKNNKNGLERAIAAYNAGPGNVDRYRGIPPFRETRAYVKRVMTYYRQYSGASNRHTLQSALRPETDEVAD